MRLSEKRHTKRPLSHAPIDGIAKHRTGNASRNGRILDVNIAFAASPDSEKVWQLSRELPQKTFSDPHLQFFTIAVA